MYIALKICALIFNIYFVSFSGSSYIGLPERSWTEASAACNLLSKETIESGEMINFNSTYIKDVSKVWIGTWVKYSHWSAYIGCGNGFTTEPQNTDSTTKAALRECLIYCSDNPSFSHIAVQNSKCRCLSGIQSSNKGNDCRQKCANDNESLCGSGHSAMLFTFVKGFSVKSSEAFIGDECAAVNPANLTYSAVPCQTKMTFSCKNSSNSAKTVNWDEYQEKCKEDGEDELYDGWYIGQNPKMEPFWTPIFRVHKTYNVGKFVKRRPPSAKSVCLSLLLNQVNSKDQNSAMFVPDEDCSKHYPFLCVKSGNGFDEYEEKSTFPREITLSIYIIIAIGVIITVLIVIVTLGSFQYRKRMSSYKVEIESLTQNLRANNVSTYQEFIDSQVGDDFAYRELDTGNANISLASPDAIASAIVQGEQLDCDAYELPELHYHTISEEAICENI